MNIFLYLLASVGLNLLLGVIASIKKTDLLTDISYGFTFIVLAITAYYLSPTYSLVKLILLAVVILWAVRIATYLFIRIMRTKRDDRFDGIRENPRRFLSFWLLQGVTVWVVLLPVLSLFSIYSSLYLNWISVVGLVVALLGLIIETVADIQKFKFKSDDSNKGKWIDTGLWRYSRHPNYLGEIMVWVGVFIYVLPFINNVDMLVIVSPIFIYILLTQVSGIPTLEKKYLERYANNKEYQKYKARTGRLLFKFR